VTLTPGKLAGLEAVSDARGVIAAIAMDQRGSLARALAKVLGADPSVEMLREVKALVTEVLTPYASAVLLDPVQGLEAAARRRPNAGLLLAYEQTGYDKTGPGRLPDLLETWSVRRLREAGADGVKVVLYYSPFDSPSINDRKHAWVERIGDECRALDVPFFLEFVGYDDALDEAGLDYARRKPDIVAGSIAEFTRDRYGADVLKVEVPVNVRFIEGAPGRSGPWAYSRDEARAHVARAAAAATKPFIYLSAGVTNTEFTDALSLAAEAGARLSGVLCGRATWSAGLPAYAAGGRDAFRAWLATEGVLNIQNVNRALTCATPWFAIHGASAPDALL
jgi:tagatose 1,6-diphosphate aldolase